MTQVVASGHGGSMIGQTGFRKVDDIWRHLPQGGTIYNNAGFFEEKNLASKAN